jgi:putative transposase
MVRTSSGAVFALTAHLVFVIKYRRRVFTGPILDRAELIIRDTADTLHIRVIEINGEADHIHLLIDYPPVLSIATIAGRLKGTTARILFQEHGEHLRKQLWGGHLWSPSYFASSTGGAPLDVVRSYIANQSRPE